MYLSEISYVFEKIVPETARTETAAWPKVRKQAVTTPIGNQDC